MFNLLSSVFRNQIDPSARCSKPFPVGSIHFNICHQLCPQQGIGIAASIISGDKDLLCINRTIYKQLVGAVHDQDTLVGTQPEVSVMILGKRVNIIGDHFSILINHTYLFVDIIGGLINGHVIVHGKQPISPGNDHPFMSRTAHQDISQSIKAGNKIIGPKTLPGSIRLQDRDGFRNSGIGHPQVSLWIQCHTPYPYVRPGYNGLKGTVCFIIPGNFPAFVLQQPESP